MASPEQAKAIELGVDIVEFDVRESSDGALVIMHDALLDRTMSLNDDVPPSRFCRPDDAVVVGSAMPVELTPLKHNIQHPAKEHS